MTSPPEAGNDGRITVVVPAYAALGTIDRAIDSALAQCGGKIRIVVVIDDGSDETRALVERRGDARIQVVMNARNLGAPASRNHGLMLATTRFVSFLDADDFYCGDFLGPLVSAMAESGADVGFGPNLLWTPRGYARYKVPDYRDNADVFLRWFGAGEHVNTASVVWSTQYLRSIGGWDEAVSRNQDGELALRAMLLGARFAQSSSGAGVWCNRNDPSRISERADNLGALLDVVSKLESLPSDAVGSEVRKEASAGHLHNIALRAYRLGQDEVGDEAMRRRRALGYADRVGTAASRAAVMLRRLPKGPRRIAWRLSASLVRGLHRLAGRGERWITPSDIPELAANDLRF